MRLEPHKVNLVSFRKDVLSMATNYRFHCPYCSHLMHVTSHPVHYGSPLKACPKCGQIYVDPYSRELALEPYRAPSAFTRLGTSVFVGIALALVPAVIVLLVTSDDPLSLRVWGICSVVFWLLAFAYSTLNKNRQNKQQLNQWKCSEQRLKNPEYAAQLALLGYPVPAQYLPANFKANYSKPPYQQAAVSKVSFV